MLAKCRANVAHHTQIPRLPASYIELAVVLCRGVPQCSTEVTFDGDAQNIWTIDVPVQTEHVARLRKSILPGMHRLHRGGARIPCLLDRVTECCRIRNVDVVAGVVVDGMEALQAESRGHLCGDQRTLV